MLTTAEQGVRNESQTIRAIHIEGLLFNLWSGNVNSSLNDTKRDKRTIRWIMLIDMCQDTTYMICLACPL